VIVTLGKDGARLLENGKEPRGIPSLEVEAVDSTGAGDSFLGAFAYGIASGLPYDRAAQLACAAAAVSVQSVGAQQSYAHSGHPSLNL
jgi:ribokinase